MTNLILAAVFFVGTHLGISGTRVRDLLVTWLGERPYLIGYSVLSLITLVWLVEAYKVAPHVELWGQLYALRPVAVVVMLVAFILAVTGLTTPSPTLAGAERLVGQAGIVRGVLRITRHPFLSGVALWATIHLLVNGDLAALVLFGSLGVLAGFGALSIDAKRARLLGAEWDAFKSQTSALPFLAIVQGRNRLAVGEVGWWRLLSAVVAFAGFLYFHGGIFGVPLLAL